MESESDPLTRRAVDLFEKEPLKGNSEVHLHTPTKFGEDRSKDLGGDREQTDRQTNRQTDKRCSIYSMMCLVTFFPRASDSLCLMVTMLVPRTEKIPLFTDLEGKITPYFSQNEDFLLQEKSSPFPISRRAHCVMTPFETNLRTFIYSCNTFFSCDFPLAFS